MTDTRSESFLQDFSRRWLAAWNSHDTERVMNLLHPEIRWEDTVFWTEVLHGHDAVRTYIERIWNVMPDVQFDEVQTFTAPADGRALCLFRQYGHGPSKLAPEATFSTYGCDIFLQFSDGLLSSYLAQYEITEMMRQLDVLPPRGDRIGGAYLLSLTNRRARTNG